MRVSVTCARIALFITVFTSFAFAQNDDASQKIVEQPRKKIYDEDADAKKAIDMALASAKRENRRVLIQWGGNWCPWCIRLHEQFTGNRELSKTLLYEYDFVLVDIGKRTKNLDLAEKYGADLKKNGVPFLTVLDPNGKVLINQPTDPFETKFDDGSKGHDADKLQTFLKTHKPAPLDGSTELEKAIALAAKTERAVLVHFGAPWCSWCQKLDAWLALPEISAVLEKDFVDLKIDMERTEGAKEVLNRYNASGESGLPWIVLVDGKGKTIITGNGPDGNIGFPSDSNEVAHFAAMLRSAKRRITEKEIADLCLQLGKRGDEPPATR